MAKSGLKTATPYTGACVVMTTKHAKSVAVGPMFEQILGAAVVEYPLDTDALGTFSGEVEREGTALECAQRKCEMGLDLIGACYGVASEGSFGPHPYIPFIPGGQEILYFIDRKRNFHLHLSTLCNETNYSMQAVDSLAALQEFAETALFPSHALVVRPNVCQVGEMIFKGLTELADLQSAFYQSQRHSSDSRVWVETDMRAHLNPTRMSQIGHLAHDLARRLATLCPTCHAPGWGMVNAEKGLSCEYCNEATEMIALEVFGCVLCGYVERKERQDGLKSAPQMNCGFCNP